MFEDENRSTLTDAASTSTVAVIIGYNIPGASPLSAHIHVCIFRNKRYMPDLHTDGHLLCGQKDGCGESNVKQLFF